jgi:hypothetical protein
MSGRAGRALPGSDAGVVGESFIMIPVQREEYVTKLMEHGRRLHRLRCSARTGLSLSAPQDSTAVSASVDPYFGKLQAKVDLAENLMWGPLEPVYSQLKAVAQPPGPVTSADAARSFVKLTKCGLRRAVLEAVGTGIAASLSHCRDFIRSTLYGYQSDDPTAVDASVDDTLKYLVAKRFIMPGVSYSRKSEIGPESSSAELVVVSPETPYVCTQIGRAAFVSGLR